MCPPVFITTYPTSSQTHPDLGVSERGFKSNFLKRHVSRMELLNSLAPQNDGLGGEIRGEFGKWGE
jgi:hypothetical protein